MDQKEKIKLEHKKPNTKSQENVTPTPITDRRASEIAPVVNKIQSRYKNQLVTELLP